jgi:hypothetical protein
MSSLVSWISNIGQLSQGVQVASREISDAFIYEARAAFEEIKNRLALVRAQVHADKSFKTQPYTGDAALLKAECSALTSLVSLTTLVDLRSGFSSSSGGSSSSSSEQDSPADDEVFLVFPVHKRTPPAGGAKTPIGEPLLVEYRKLEMWRMSFGHSVSIQFELVQLIGTPSTVLPAQSFSIPDDLLEDGLVFPVLRGEGAKHIIKGLSDVHKKNQQSKETANPRALPIASGPGPTGDVSALLQGLGSVLGEVVAALRPPSAPAPAGEPPIAVSSEQLKGKQTLLRFSRISSALASALRSFSSLDKKAWGSMTRNLFLAEGVSIPLAAAEAVSLLQFATSPSSPSSLAALYRGRYPGAPDGPIDLEKQLSTLSFVIATLNKGDAGTPFVEHIQATVHNLIARVRSAQQHELTVYATSMVPGILDQIEAFTADTLYSVAQLRADHPHGWYAPRSRLADTLDREIATAQAQQLAFLSQQLTALRTRGKGPATSKDLAGGGASKDSAGHKKRQRDGPAQGPLSDVCSKVITSGKEGPCGRPFCTFQHAFPVGTSDSDKAAAKARIEKFLEKGHKKAR